MAEERTTEEEKMHIMEGEGDISNFLFYDSLNSYSLLARRRAAAKRKKLKNLGKSKSTDTEEEDADDDCGDDGMSSDLCPPRLHSSFLLTLCFLRHWKTTYPQLV